MKKELILNYNLNKDFSSEWVALKLRSMSERIHHAKSIQISWRNVSGVFNGAIDLCLSNDESKYAISESFTINSADNSEDVVLCDINSNAEYIRLKYIKNGIISGKLELLIIYERD